MGTSHALAGIVMIKIRFTSRSHRRGAQLPTGGDRADLHDCPQGCELTIKHDRIRVQPDRSHRSTASDEAGGEPVTTDEADGVFKSSSDTSTYCTHKCYFNNSLQWNNHKATTTFHDCTVEERTIPPSFAQRELWNVAPAALSTTESGVVWSSRRVVFHSVLVFLKSLLFSFFEEKEEDTQNPTEKR